MPASKKSKSGYKMGADGELIGVPRTAAFSKPSRTFKKKVQAIVAGESETKYVCESLRNTNGLPSTLATFRNFSSAITGTTELYACIPQVSEGARDHQRIGDSISPTSAYVNLNLVATSATDLQSWDVTAHVFVLSAKQVKYMDNLSAVPISELMDNGQGGAVGFDGTLPTTLFKLNTAGFTVHAHRKVRLVKNFGWSNNGTGSFVPTQSSTVVDSRAYANIKIKVPLPKKLRYIRDSANYPDNSAPFLCIGWVRNDASGDTAASTFIEVEGKIHMFYKDL
jgi:hypothetical protein